MSTTRTQHYKNTLVDLNVPRVGAPITLTLFTPNNQPVQNLDGQTVKPGAQATTSTITDGSYDISGWALGDLPAGCYYEINEDGFIVDTSDTTYSGTAISVTTLYPPIVTANTLLMKAQVVNLGQVVQGFAIGLSLSDKAVNAESESIPGGVQRWYNTNSLGLVQVPHDITSTLDPNTVVNKIQWGPGGFIESYIVPDHPHGYQGAYAGGTTYHVHSGTKVSPADVVLWTDTKLYRYIGPTDTSGHDPTNATYWAPFDGEFIEWNIVSSGTPGERAFSADQITAVATVPGALDGSPATVQDILSNLLFQVDGQQTYTPTFQGATDNPTETYTVQIGRYQVLGKRCRVTIVLVTSTMAKTTLTDNIRVSLPVAAANVSNLTQLLEARLENGTAVKNATQAETTPNVSYLQLRYIPATAASALLTFGTADLGVLTNTITCVITGEYETV